MKKILTTALFTIFSISIWAQWSDLHHVELEWKDTEFSTSCWSQEFASQACAAGDVPVYFYRINIPTNGKLNTRITNTTTSEISCETPQIVMPDWNIESTISKSGTSYYANISVTPIRKGKDSYEKLISFDIELSLDIILNGSSRDPIFATQSVLKSGEFYKIAIGKSGVYGISGLQLKDNLSINIQDLDPSAIQVYTGNSGKLNEKVDGDRVDDLVEIPIQIVGGSDNNISESDMIKFFAYGPDTWSHNTNDGYVFEKNVYSKQNYVYIKINGSNGLRIKQSSTPSNLATYVSQDYDFLQIYDVDKTNLLGAYQSTEGTGQIWFNEYFGVTTEQNFTDKFDFRGLVTSKDVDVSYEMASRSSSSTRSILTIDGKSIENNYSSSNITDTESLYAKRVLGQKTLRVNSQPSININYVKTNSKDEAWLNYIKIINRRAIGEYSEQYIVQDKNSLDFETARYEGNLSTSSAVWNVTNFASTSAVGHTGGDWSYDTQGALQRFVVFNDVLTPEFIGAVENQDLHSISEVDMIIVHPTEFQAEADRLAAHRSSYNDISVKTVDIKMIYNEYSSGKVDPTALRDFAKMLHDRSDNFKYLLLLGDGSYDYRNIVVGLADHNFVPVYETRNSLDPINGFPTDDYYGLLSNDEGENDLRGDLDIYIGRIPVENEEQAGNVIDKIIQYDTGDNRYGDWRLKIGFSADDENSNRHLNDSDEIAVNVRVKDPVYNQHKIYFDAFEQESTPGGDRYNGASNAINNNVQSGQLILNYLGHGGPNGWAQERVLKLSDIDTWNNSDELPILITATCSFTGFDDPNIVSAGEYALRKKNGGCVALYTTVRAVFSNENKNLTNAVFKNIFEREDNSGLTLGAIMTAAKNSLSQSGTRVHNQRKFSLIGDPSMKIAVPSLQIATTHINGIEVSEAKTDTLKALEEVIISGVITDQNNVIKSDFNGKIYPTIYDKSSSIETLANDGTSTKVKFDVFKNILFKGVATVTNGEFTFKFILPKDINYKFGNGRISYYADNDTDIDAAGFYENIIIGGSSTNISNDDEAPVVKLFINDTDFGDGGVTTKDATLLVNLSDDYGINTSGTSIGHDITATLDGEEVFILNDFYEASIDDFSKGSVRFPLNDLSLGLHSMTVKAWDLSNNSGEATITFEVVESLDGKIINVYTYPNPTLDIEEVFVVFEHDLVGVPLTLHISLYNSIGQLVVEKNQPITPSGNRVVTKLAGSNNKIKDLPQGMYYYKIKLTSVELNTSRESNFEKLVKVR